MASGAVHRVVLLPQRGGGFAQLSKHSTTLTSTTSISRTARPGSFPTPYPSPFCTYASASRPVLNQSLTSLNSKLTTPHASGLRLSSRLSAPPASWRSPIGILRQFSSSQRALKNAQVADKQAAKKDNAETTDLESKQPGKDEQPVVEGFRRTERASKAAHVNLRARLTKDGKDTKKFTDSLKDILRLLKIVGPELPTLSFAVFLLFISSAATMGMPWIVGKVMNFSQGPIEDVRVFGLDIYQFFGTCAAVLTLGAAANFGRVILLRIIGEKVVARLRTRLFKRTYSQDAEFFDANRTGDLISRLSSDTIIVAKAVTQNLSDGLRAIVSGTTGLVLMIYISPSLTTIILYAAPLIGASAFVYGRVVRKLSREMQKSIGTLTKIAEERLGNVKTSQAFVGEQLEVRRYNHQVKKIFNLGKRQSVWDASFFSSSGWMGNMTLVTLLWYSSGMVRSGVLTPGDFTTFMLYAGFAGSSLFGVSGFFSELMKGVGAADRLFELQDRKPGISATKGIKVTSAQGPIKFDNVTFAYPTRPAVTIFNGLSFEIPSGSNVCIVGPSGGGKSTVSSLLLRFYDPTSGTISINGVDISKMNVKSLRRRIGMVSQEPVLFSGTVAENIAYGRPNATRSEIILAAQRANCQFISDFPHGLETQVGARGAQLSGGQKQRIAIARALLKDPDILILDEATSALDAESETLVNAALGELLKGRNTTISIAHRLSTIKRSDQIIVLNSNGTVAETGSYAELNANKESAFSKLMEWQMSGGDVPDAHSRHDGHVHESEIIEEDLEEEDEENTDEKRDEEKTKN
ncbi:hypothetical protein DL771_006033 [Monosporascus sp. 5C6A]|nr:hypothetical protein DL771_006033 [Monosporascus sp. 5C6A]